MTGHQTVLILDYGSQYTQLIARRVRELGVYSVILPGDISLERMLAGMDELKAFRARGIHDKLSPMIRQLQPARRRCRQIRTAPPASSSCGR